MLPPPNPGEDAAPLAAADQDARDEKIVAVVAEPVAPKPNKKSASEEPKLGAYVMREKTAGGTLDDVLFDWDHRWNDFSIPSWQSEMHNALIRSQGEVLASSLPAPRQEFFLVGLKQLYRSACVLLPATAKAPAVLGDYLKSHEQIMEYFRSELDDTAFNLAYGSLKYTAGTLAVLAGIGTAALYWSDKTVAAGNYVLAAAAALAGLFVSDFMLPRVESPEEFERRLRLIQKPFGRILVTCIVALFGSLFVSSGTLAIKIGDWVSSDLKKHTELALFVGFLTGVPSSWLARQIMGFLSDRKEPKLPAPSGTQSGSIKTRR